MNFNIITYMQQIENVALIPSDKIIYSWKAKDQQELESGEYLRTKESIRRVVVEIAKDRNLITKSRKRELVDRRKYLFHVLRDKANLSLSDIGRAFKKDHATILYGLRSYDQLKDLPDFIENVKEIRSFLDDIEPLKKTR